MEVVDVLAGKKFARLTVVRTTSSKNSNGEYLVECKCDCGNDCITTTHKLKSGRKKSCGCLARELSSLRATKHGEHGSTLYVLWSGMKQRCTNKNKDNYPSYGGVGITVCEEWSTSFESFSLWAYLNGYKDGLSLDRISNNKGYSPDNCRFINKTCQNLNKNILDIGFKKDSPNRPYFVYIGLYGNNYYFGCYSDKENALRVRKTIVESFIQSYGQCLSVDKEDIYNFVQYHRSILGVRSKPRKKQN